jgi:hypothetical protein
MKEKASTKYLPKTMTFEFIVSSCNAEVAKRFIGAWIPVLRTMLEVMAVISKVKPALILNKLIASSSASDSKQDRRLI